ncbi:unnamed protein product [Ranitomeya imitator]|uniref:c-SKI SMAD4-binding domain-containing protein n=1 Tax=Ranitomeya imitator TaxID=111125 RepID=A0ABN9KZ59_9NEOB|nr:unnamed protein product [Ranitomeya imitator]
MEIEDFKDTAAEGNKDGIAKSASVSLGGSSELNPGLKHTLAQFNLSSRSSLGGPAAFSARFSQENMSPAVFLPLPSPQIHPGPLLIPPDSSTELTQTELEGESISCFMVGDQLHILKVLGILPFNAPSCGLITLTDAQRLCNALLRPHTYPQNGSLLPAKNSLAQLKETGSAFEVEHDCLGKCQGLFAPQLYAQPDAPCIQCLECYGMFSTQTFVMHSHRAPDKRTCHWGFDSAKWHCYLHLSPKYQNTPEVKKTKVLFEEMKEKFSKNNQPKRIQPKVLDHTFIGTVSNSDRPCRKLNRDKLSNIFFNSKFVPARKGVNSFNIVLQMAVRIWNCLPEEVVMANSVEGFKRGLDVFLEQNNIVSYNY